MVLILPRVVLIQHLPSEASRSINLIFWDPAILSTIDVKWPNVGKLGILMVGSIWQSLSRKIVTRQISEGVDKISANLGWVPTSELLPKMHSRRL